MNEFNPNCGRCGMLNSRGFCSLTACRYPSNVIVSSPKVIRGMMVNPQIEKPLSNGDKIRSMSDYDLAEFLYAIMDCCWNDACGTFSPMWKCCNDGPDNVGDWLKLPADLPVMYYPQVDGITPTVISDKEGEG